MRKQTDPSTAPQGEAQPVGGAPERIWIGAADADGECAVWFDLDEGGTEYIRADIAHPPKEGEA